VNLVPKHSYTVGGRSEVAVPRQSSGAVLGDELDD
jgi:hypothetical protein